MVGDNKRCSQAAGVRTTGFAPAARTSTSPSAPLATCAAATSPGQQITRYIMVLPHFILAVDCLLVAFMERVCGYFCLPACIYVVLLLLAIQKAMQTPPHYPTSGGYMGPGTPPSMYLGGGAPPYGSSMFNGPAVTRYGIPQFPGGSAYSYGYGGPIPMGSPYGPMQIAGPTPYSGGTMMTAGNRASLYDRHALFCYCPCIN